MKHSYDARWYPTAHSASRSAAVRSKTSGSQAMFCAVGRAVFSPVLLAATLVVVAPGVHAGAADEPSGSDDSDFLAVAPVVTHMFTSLDDDALESIRGRYVDFNTLSDGTGSSGGFVILWDEHPLGGGSSGSSTDKSLSNGHNNQQDTRVTTWRGQ